MTLNGFLLCRLLTILSCMIRCSLLSASPTLPMALPPAPPSNTYNSDLISANFVWELASSDSTVLDLLLLVYHGVFHKG
ncbi:hypothetical protein BDB00DRAFT_831613 [Zychaea mexicana]|uniref:uncharacterized protein n=1 Tax=Zychaea mexicana TaxID=64656 RepID=UPI0022FF092F|nr:uncharacterized protein BDB00DRAFT_831613 [Zychaea mexicana]KAI9491656.1 hypothetical protein BDB00DRAFT_831613 [Zychaea mexicana]